MDYQNRYITEQAFKRTLDVTLGVFIGGINGARGHSATSNLTNSVVSGGIVNGLNALFGEQKFLSRETLVSTVSMTAVSAVMHMLAKSASNHRQMESRMAFTEECAPCKLKSSWSARMLDEEKEKELAR